MWHTRRRYRCVKLLKKDSTDGRWIWHLNITDSDEDYGATARKATKRQRANETKEMEMVEQGKRIVEIVGETMQPLTAAVRDSQNESRYQSPPPMCLVTT
jgi:hypothetical protein